MIIFTDTDYYRLF